MVAKDLSNPHQGCALQLSKGTRHLLAAKGDNQPRALHPGPGGACPCPPSTAASQRAQARAGKAGVS